MMEKKITYKFIKFFFDIIIIIILIISTINIYKEVLISLNTIDKNNLFIVVGALFYSIFIAIINNIIIIGTYIAVRLASRKVNQLKLDETDFEKSKNYYRDIIKNYSISELNYIDKFKLEKKQAYTAKLLELEKKKIIEINDRKINIIGKAIDKTDKVFTDSIKNNKVTIPLNEYKEVVISESLSKGLIETPRYQDTFKHIIGAILFTATISVLYSFLFSIPFNSNFEEIFEKYNTILAILIIISGSLIICLFIYIFTFSFKASNESHYKRTKKGMEINKKLDGLKLFMKEFSKINNKEAKHLILWEDYLIYSVMFDINKKIQDEYSKYF